MKKIQTKTHISQAPAGVTTSNHFPSHDQTEFQAAPTAARNLVSLSLPECSPCTEGTRRLTSAQLLRGSEDCRLQRP